MENTLIKSLKPLLEKSLVAEQDTQLRNPEEQEDYKEIVKEVIIELKAQKKIG